MKRWRQRTAGNAVALAALAVVVFASPAAASVPSTTTVQASPSPVDAGQPVTLSATVSCSGDPAGGFGMTFSDGQDVLATVQVSGDGSAAYTARLGSTGLHTITASYAGSDDCDASSATTTVEVSGASTPPVVPNFPCILCNGLINFTTGDIHNTVEINGRPANRVVPPVASGLAGHRFSKSG